MSGIIDRLPILFEESMEDLPYLKDNAKNPKKDKNGSASNTLANLIRFIGVSEFLLNQNIEGFRRFLSDAAQIRLSLIERFDKGEAISKSYVSMLSYKSLFNALASGDLGLAKKLASTMGGRDDIEREYDHPFDRALGYALKAIVLNSVEQGEKAAEFRTVIEESGNIDFIGYADAFEAILNCDAESFMNALQSIVSNHKKQSKGNGVFRDSEDEVLCIWGVGLVNLAKLRGMEIKFDDPLIPVSLVS